VPGRFIRRFQELLSLARRAPRRRPVTGARAPQTPAETSEDHGGDNSHSPRKQHKQCSERNKLRYGARTPEQALSDPALELTHTVGEGGDGSRRGRGPRTMIFVSRLAQPVCIEQRVEELESKS